MKFYEYPHIWFLREGIHVCTGLYGMGILTLNGGSTNFIQQQKQYHLEDNQRRVNAEQKEFSSSSTSKWDCVRDCRCVHSEEVDIKGCSIEVDYDMDVMGVSDLEVGSGNGDKTTTNDIDDSLVKRRGEGEVLEVVSVNGALVINVAHSRSTCFSLKCSPSLLP